MNFCCLGRCRGKTEYAEHNTSRVPYEHGNVYQLQHFITCTDQSAVEGLVHI